MMITLTHGISEEKNFKNQTDAIAMRLPHYHLKSIY